MSDAHGDRQLLAIMFTDVVGYTALTERDEAGAVRVREALSYLLSLVEAEEPDVLVAEAGASPLEPYNGEIAKEVIRDHVRFKLLCAQDPYAVVGVMSAFERQPDLVAGGAANTTAGIRLVKRLSGLDAMNLNEAAAREALLGMLMAALDL